MKLRSVLIGLVAMLPLALLPTPAQADVPRIPIRCGLIVQEDAYLYLKKNLYCPGPIGVAVLYNAEERHAPRVTVDLKGHTLRGPGSGGGITAFVYSNYAYLTVINGRVENWHTGVGGDRETSVKNVKLVDNEIGFWCNGNCAADLSYFKKNKTAFNVGGEASALITHSTFSRNQLGITVIFLSDFTANRNTFFKNDIAMNISCMGSYRQEKNRFFKNRIDVNDQSDAC
jgi:hypothetical protein